MLKSLLLGAALLGVGLAVPAFAQSDGMDGQGAPAAVTPPAAPATAQAPAAPPLFSGITVGKGAGMVVTLPHPAASIFAADPSVVEVRPASPTSLFVFGKGIGETTIVATDSNGGTVAQYAVTVGPSGFAGDRIAAQSTLAAPGSDVSAESEPNGMIVRGTVTSPEEASQVMNQARIISPAGPVVNDLSVAEPIQVELKVRIAYMSRSITRQLGIDWGAATDAGFRIGRFALTGNTGTGSPSISGTSPGVLGVTFPGGTFEGVIDALASDNLAHIVAEPTLTTVSGTEANFVVGGEFPVPVAEAGTGNQATISIEFKTYGVQLDFTPTVFSNGQISLRVSPQLSQLSNANSVTESTGGTSSAIVVPALTVQAASTTVILGSGQGMAIAGLLEDSSNQTDNAVPGVGELPVLGALFRGDAFQRQQQELVITVTPYLVNPVSDATSLAVPDDGWTPANDLQRILLLRDNGTERDPEAIPGDAGFLVQ